MMSTSTIRRFGPFDVYEKLGHGGMASVFKARYAAHTHARNQETPLEHPGEDVVALKIANWVVVSEPVLAQRFFNEYQVTRRLQHANLVRALGYGVENDLPYLVLEYVPGRSLDKYLKELGPLSLDRALAVFTEMVQAVTFIHQNKLIHRDIKPGNILIDKLGNAKLADMGLMKDLESETLLTHSRAGLGTLAFAAPEQFDDAGHVDCRADVFGLAAAFYFAVSGKFPFGTGSPIQVMRRKLQHQLVPLTQLLPNLSAAQDQIVRRALHPDPAVRPDSAEDFLAGLRGRMSTDVIPIPKTQTEAPPSGQGRRTHVRFPIRLLTTLGELSSANQRTLPAHILDVSTAGLCLECPQGFELNTLLQVDLPAESAGMTSSYQVLTRWGKQLPNQNWVYGCQFVHALEKEDLERILFQDQSKTTGCHASETNPNTCTCTPKIAVPCTL